MQLLDDIRRAFAEVKKAEQIAEIAKSKFDERSAELVSRSKALGTLLLEAKKLHPKVADFKALLYGVKGLKLSRAYDLMRLAGGRVTDEQLREEARERQRKSRANKKKKSNQEPNADSVTEPHVTESPEISIEQRKAEMAALDMTAEDKSARALAEFIAACHLYLPKITTEADRDKARLVVTELTTTRAEAA